MIQKKYSPMKILNSKQPSMDNKLKFTDRFKVLINSDTQKGADPYVFNDTEQPYVVATGGKNIKLIAPNKNSKIPNSNRNKSKGKCLKTKIKLEPTPSIVFKTEPESEVKHLGQAHSQYTHQQKQRYLKNLQRIKSKRRRRDHTLQYYPRAADEISDSDSSCDELQTYQRHWFGGETDPTLPRSNRLAQLHSQLQRQLHQLQFEDEELENSLKKKTRCLLEAAIRDPTATAQILSDSRAGNKITDGPLIVGGPCGVDGCTQISLPCTRHCSRHIMLNTDQLLFEHCTAKFSDNTQCCVPVFDVAHELPLCPEHARKRDNYHRRAQESKPKKARSKKPTSPPVAAPAIPTTMSVAVAPVTPKPSKPKSKPKKRKRSSSRSKIEIKPVIKPVIAPVMPPVARPLSPELIVPDIIPQVTLPPAVTAAMMPDVNHFANPIISVNDMQTKTLNNLNVLPQQANTNTVTSLNNLGLDIGSLGLGAGLKVELDDSEVFLDHATDHDFENVLNNLPADAFNDLFIEGRNGVYEPTREEEEILEQAVEAFDKDVRNLERLGQTHGLLEPALLAQIMSDIVS